MIIFIVNDFLYRTWNAVNEWRYYRNHYKDIVHMFNITFSYNFQTKICFFVIVFLTGVLSHSLNLNSLNFGNIFTMTIGIFIGIFICFIMGFQECDLNIAHLIRNTNHNLDYASCSAISYYYGYLRLIGPSTGTDTKGIVERIELYESTELVEIPVKKLFIFIPKNFSIPPNLSEINRDKPNARRLEDVKNLESVYIDRAGVRNRDYGNGNIYRFKSNKKVYYVCIEGATPIKTMYEAIKENPKIAKMKLELLYSFNNKLIQLIKESTDTKFLFDVILFDENDNLVDILEERIRQHVMDDVKKED